MTTSSSRVCIIGPANLKHISLLSLYTEVFQREGITYDIIYIDIYGIDESIGAVNHYKMTYKDEYDKNPSSVKKFLAFRKYVKSVLSKNKYDFIVTWQATSAYILFDYLLLHYKKRYCLNIRDYIMENNIVARTILKILLKKCTFTAISSEGFLTFLPKYSYVKVNSINEQVLSGIKPVTTKNGSVPLKIGFVGNFRYMKDSSLLVDALKNDPRYELWFCGTNSEKIGVYASDNNINNVKVIGAFPVADTISIMSKFDIINSAFGNDAYDNSTLMPIRLYTAIALGKPVLANSGTQLSKEVTSKRLGFAVESYDSLGEDLMNYYTNLDQQSFIKYSTIYLEKCRQENKIFEEVLLKALCK